MELAKARFKAFTTNAWYNVNDHKIFDDKFENCASNGPFDEIVESDLLLKQVDDGGNDGRKMGVEILLNCLSEDLRRTGAFYGHPSILFHHFLKEDIDK